MAKRDQNLEAVIFTLLSMDYSNPEIAEVTDRTVGSVNGLITRMRKRGIEIPNRRGHSLTNWRAKRDADVG